jgi:hypothetical protein
LCVNERSRGLHHVGSRVVHAEHPRRHARAVHHAFSIWLKQNPAVKVGALAEAARPGDIIFNAANGSGTLSALQLAGEANLNGKVLVDIANPLDFSRGR